MREKVGGGAKEKKRNREGGGFRELEKCGY